MYMASIISGTTWLTISLYSFLAQDVACNTPRINRHVRLVSPGAALIPCLRVSQRPRFIYLKSGVGRSHLGLFPALTKVHSTMTSTSPGCVYTVRSTSTSQPSITTPRGVRFGPSFLRPRRLLNSITSRMFQVSIAETAH